MCVSVVIPQDLMRESWVKAEWDERMFKREETRETLSGEIIGMAGITMVTKLGLFRHFRAEDF